MPIEIAVEGVSKRFKKDWIFRGVEHRFAQGSKTAVLGRNGSGKSTFLKLLTGYVGLSEGLVQWTLNDEALDMAKWHHHFSYCAPYLELIEEYSLEESLRFHFDLKPLRKEITLASVLEDSGLAAHMKKPVGLFSSGMKQRLKLILALCSDVDVYFLDEPCSNLDEAGIAWYQTMVESVSQDKSLIVASNSKVEYYFCDQQIDIQGYRPTS
ncbi:MAG: ABC transporter ATP-binding protein [Bacteroidia bacterium]|nr:ABC transporter ATP-binding protein [Bacteroidia bacterium]